MRLAIWGARPPSTSPVAAIVAATLPALSRVAEIDLVSLEPAAVVAADLDVYHVDQSPALAHAYRASQLRPGLVVLHEWNLHDAAWREAKEAGRVETYRREMRLAYRETGTAAARQLVRGKGSATLAALCPLVEPLLARSLAAVVPTSTHAERARRAMGDRPVLHWPTPLLPLPAPTRDAARAALGIPMSAFVVSVPDRTLVAGALAARPDMHVVTHASDSLESLAVADVVVVPGHIWSAHDARVARHAMTLGRVVLVAAGTELADDLLEGTAIPIDAGPYQEAELLAVVDRLRSDPALGERIGRLAREHVRQTHDIGRASDALADFVQRVHAQADALRRAVATTTRPADTLSDYLHDEVAWTARDLGLPALPSGVLQRVAEAHRRTFA